MCVYAGTSDIIALSSAAPQEFQTHRGEQGFNHREEKCISVMMTDSDKTSERTCLKKYNKSENVTRLSKNLVGVTNISQT